MKARINGSIYEGADPADCMWEYMRSCGYPLDQEAHGRRVAARVVAKKLGTEASQEA